MPQCAAFNCNIRSQKGVAMYLFPKDPKFRRIWVHNLRRDGFVATKTSRLCARHFTDDQFSIHPSVAKKCGYKIIDLKPDAVPTIFDFPKTETKTKMRRKSTASFKRNALEICNAIDKSPTQFPKPSAMGKSQTSVMGASLADPCLSNEHDFGMRESSTTLNCDSNVTQTFHAFTQTSNESLNISIQASPQTREIGIQVDIYGSERDTVETEEPDDNLVESDSEMDDSDIEWSLPNEEDDEEMKPKNVSSICGDTKFIVYKSSLEQLLPSQCLLCGTPKQDTDFEWRALGTVVHIQSTCNRCDCLWEWASQPFTGMMPWGNLVFAAAILFSGASPLKAINTLKFAGIQCFSNRTYFSLQQLYLVPAVEMVWQKNQQEMFDSLRERGLPVKLGGDARCCSPGHTAKFGSYSLMNLDSSKVLDVQLVQSNEVHSSYHMELEGLKRSLARLEEEDIDISHLVTDRHSQVKCYMKRDQPHIVHLFDVWHVAKGVYRKLHAISKNRLCDVVGEWSHSISNHLYWCAASSNGNGDLISQKWLSILNHVVDVHEGHGDLYPRCLHGPLDDRDWIKQGSKAYVELEAVVKGKLLVNDIQKLSHIGQTSSLESFHKVVCAFAPKAVHFFFKQMQARLFLAAMHFNENSSRQQSMTKDGNKQYAVSYPKGRGGEGVAKEVKVDQTFNYIADLMDAVVELRELNDSYTKARDAIDRHVQVPPPIAQSTPKPPKDVTIQRHTTRFN